MNITYRKATEADTDTIIAFVRNAIKVLDSQGIFQWDEVYPAREDFASDIAREEAFVAEIACGENKAIAAVFTLNTECDEEYKNGEWKYNGDDFIVIHRLCVNPEFQQKGLGSQICRHIIDEARQNDKKAIRLDAFSQNPLSLRMYEKFGFETVGTADWRKGRFYLMEKIIS
ncbi:MAG: GNAT family N-acetyltransferase [Treponema sp.]